MTRPDDFWRSSGCHLLARNDDGCLGVTEDFLRAYLLRPEMAPPEEACAEERQLHGRLLDEPARAVDETEFTLDFIYVQPQASRAKVRSRIISSPLHAKHLLIVLQENIKRYEQMYGEIKPAAQQVEAEADKH